MCEVGRGGPSPEGTRLADLLDHVAALPEPVRRPVARAALAAAGPACLVPLRDGISHPWWRVRRWACRLLADESLDGPTSARLVVAARGDPHKKVRAQALQALLADSYVPSGGPLGASDVPYDMVGVLLDRLRSDRSVSVRRAAVSGLHLQVTLNANRERRVRRGLERAMAAEQDETIRRRTQAALAGFAADAPTDTYTALRWALAEGRVELVLRLARAHMRRWEVSGEYGEAQKWLDRVLAASEGASAPRRAAALHDAGFAAMVTGDFDDAADHLRASVAQWDRAGDRTNRLRSQCALTFLASFGDDVGAVASLEAEVAEVRAIGDEASLFEVLAVCGQARMFRETPQLARRHFGEAVALARQPDMEPELATALVGLGSAELGQGDYAAAEAHLVEGVALTAATGDRHTEVIARCWLAELDRLRGNVQRARRALVTCVKRAQAMGAPYPQALALLGQGRAALEEGDADGASGLIQEAAAVATDARLVHLVTAARMGCGEVARARGDAAAARRLFEVAHRRAERRGNEAARARSAYHLGELARARGHLRGAASLHDEALAQRERAGDRAGVADSLEALAGLAVTAGDHDKAARLFGAAHALRDATGCARSRLASATYEADVAMLGTRMERDELEAAWAKGAALPQEEAVWHTRRGRGPRRRPSSGWDALTPAQRRVAELVAHGMTNAEVAEQLCLGLETVKSHVAKTLAKLGMASRWDLRSPSPPHR